MNPLKIDAALLLIAMGAALALPCTANAAETKTLYKCVDGKGATTIQTNKPCPAGSTEAWKRAAEREPAPSPSQLAEARAREQRNQQQVRDLSVEVQQKLRGEPTVVSDPAPGSHLSATTPGQPPAGSQLAPVSPADAPEPQAVRIDNCQAAQAFASAVREKTWIGLKDDQTKRIYGWVADQCRVNTKPED